MDDVTPDASATYRVDRRRFLRLGLLTATGALLAACAPAAAPAPTSAPAKPAEPQGGATPVAKAAAAAPQTTTAPATKSGATGSIKLWHIWGGGREKILREVLDGFEAKNPGLTVEATLVPNPGYQPVLTTALAGGDPPDAMMVYSDVYIQGIRGNAFLAVDDRMQKDGISPDIWYPGAIQMGQYRGKTYGLPAVVDALSVFYWNKELLKGAGLDDAKPPATWAEALEATDKLKAVQGNKIERLGFEVAHRPGFVFMEYLYRNGGQLLNDEGDKVLFDSKEGLETIEFLAELTYRQGGFEAMQDFVKSFGLTDQSSAFLSKRSAMTSQGVFLISQLKESAPDLPYGAGLPPHGPSGKPQDVVKGLWSYSVPAKAKNPDAAWELVKYLGAGEGHQELMGKQSRPAMVKKYNEAPYDGPLREANPVWDATIAVFNTSIRLPLTAATNEIATIVGEAVDRARAKQQPPADALREAAQKAQAAADKAAKG
jgi:ABC-type glycerol-3-phosphate transport system substrate-binding protein